MDFFNSTARIGSFIVSDKIKLLLWQVSHVMRCKWENKSDRIKEILGDKKKPEKVETIDYMEDTKSKRIAKAMPFYAVQN